MRWAANGMLLTLVLAAGGCGTQDLILGAEGGYLFTGYDTLALPGETVQVRARVQAGDFLRAQPGLVVRFYEGGRLYRAAETDSNGVASVSYTPPAPGDTVLRAELSPIGLDQVPPGPIEILVACRQASASMAVVDMDKTLVASGFDQVLVGDPAPMPDSIRVMKRLAERSSIVYLTHRPEYFGPKSQRWLQDHDYPRGPVLLSTVGGFLKGSEEYKTEAIRRLRDRFQALRIGIGDKVGDALAYRASGLRAFLILQVPGGDDPEKVEALADDLARLPADVEVVTGWAEVERGLFNEAKFPPPIMVNKLRVLADQLRRHKGGG